MSATLSHRLVGGSSRGTGRDRHEAVRVEREPGAWNHCEKCGGLRFGSGPHAVLWRERDGVQVKVDCVGDVVPTRGEGT